MGAVFGKHPQLRARLLLLHQPDVLVAGDCPVAFPAARIAVVAAALFVTRGYRQHGIIGISVLFGQAAVPELCCCTAALRAECDERSDCRRGVYVGDGIHDVSDPGDDCDDAVAFSAPAKARSGAHDSSFTLTEASAAAVQVEAGWTAAPQIVPYGFVARIIGEGPGEGMVLGFTNPTSSSQAPISSKDQVLPSFVLTSMLTAKKRPFNGPVRSRL